MTTVSSLCLSVCLSLSLSLSLPLFLSLSNNASQINMQKNWNNHNPEQEDISDLIRNRMKSLDLTLGDYCKFSMSVCLSVSLSLPLFLSLSNNASQINMQKNWNNHNPEQEDISDLIRNRMKSLDLTLGDYCKFSMSVSLSVSLSLSLSPSLSLSL